MSINSVYVMGSLRNPNIPVVANELRKHGLDVFDDWFSAGPDADECWQRYSVERGWTYGQALRGHSAQHTFALDKKHLDRCDAGVLVLPAGKSAHLELGYLLGKGKPGYILLAGEVERFDVMYNFATGIVPDLKTLLLILCDV